MDIVIAGFDDVWAIVVSCIRVVSAVAVVMAWIIIVIIIAWAIVVSHRPVGWSVVIARIMMPGTASAQSHHELKF